MHGDSSIKNKELTKILIEGVIDHAYLRGIVVTLYVPIWKWLVMISIEIEYQLKVFEVENHLVHQGEHMAYELGYRSFVQ